MSEQWFSKRMYCPACSSDSVKPSPSNSPVIDFFCQECNENYQLKSQAKKFTSKVNDGAYGKMMEYVTNGTLPNFFFLHYNPDNYSVMNLLLVPKFFFSESIIEERKPLGPTAERAGWIGCNILFSNLAEEGKIKIIDSGKRIASNEVRKSWEKISFLQSSTQNKSWNNDILWCINRLGKKEFSLNDIYKFQDHLKELHQTNNNIEPKIRQQLQFLRDKGFLLFLGKGRYKLKD